jgi:hypothetical protein
MAQVGRSVIKKMGIMMIPIMFTGSSIRATTIISKGVMMSSQMGTATNLGGFKVG